MFTYTSGCFILLSNSPLLDPRNDSSSVLNPLSSPFQKIFLLNTYPISSPFQIILSSPYSSTLETVFSLTWVRGWGYPGILCLVSRISYIYIYIYLCVTCAQPFLCTTLPGNDRHNNNNNSNSNFNPPSYLVRPHSSGAHPFSTPWPCSSPCILHSMRHESSLAVDVRSAHCPWSRWPPYS